MKLPWQAQQWQQIWQAKTQQCLPHALLLAGVAGTGKAQFAEELARTLLCQHLKAESEACNKCHSCRLMTGKTHPNMFWIEPEKEGQAIKIDQIREASDFIQQTSLQGEHRILIIHPADNMNTNAANALLKSLEEPPAGVMIILVSHQPSHLPATILSRCQRLTFARPALADALLWLNKKMTPGQKKEIDEMNIDAGLLLRLAEGAPLGAIQLVKEGVLSLRLALYQALSVLAERKGDPLKTAANLLDFDSDRFLDLMVLWVMDLLRLQLGAAADALINQDFIKQMTAMHERASIKMNTQFMVQLHQLRAQIKNGLNMNKQLMIESVLIQWSQMVRSAHVSR